MGLAFAVEVTRSAAERRLRALSAAIPAAGLATAALQLRAGPTFALEGPPALRAAAALACALGALGFAAVALGALGRAGRRAPEGAHATVSPEAGRDLVVDESGAAALREAGDPTPRPMALRAWCTLPGLTLLVLSPYPAHSACGRPARPATLLLGRDGLSDEAWRRLHAWLRWTERGRLERPLPDPDRP